MSIKREFKLSHRRVNGTGRVVRVFFRGRGALHCYGCFGVSSGAFRACTVHDYERREVI
jgi:hypothetical protein